MTKGPWKYQKAKGHHHVIMGEETLDVNKEADARVIASVPAMVKFIKRVAFGPTTGAKWTAQQILRGLEKK